MKKSKRLLGLLLAMLMVLSLLAACGGGNQGGDAQNSTGNQGNEDAADPDSGTSADPADGEKLLRLTIGDSPETLNCQTTASNYELLLDMSATLYREIYSEEEGSTVYANGIAEGDPVMIGDDWYTWQVKVAPGFTFVDGTPIDAHTVEYSFKVLNDPNLANRNVNTDILNAEAYLTGECGWEDVGFKAIDDYTIEFSYAPDHDPTSVRDVKALFAAVGMGLVHPEKFEEWLSEDGSQAGWGTNIDHFVASGPYEPTKIIEGQHVELTKRTDGNAPFLDTFTPDRVTYTVITDSNTAIQLFESGKTDQVSAGGAAYDEYEGARFQYAADNMGIFLNSINPTVEVLKDVNFRYALYWGLDRETIIKAVYPISMPSAYQYLPISTMYDPADPDNAVVDYRQTPEAQAIRIDGHPVTQSGYDEALALDYFDKAYEANGGQPITITALYADSSDTSKTFAEAIQQQWQKLFGEERLTINLQATPYALLYEEMARDKMQYDICLSCGWYTNVEEPWNDTNWVYSGPYTYSTQYCVIASEEYQQEWDDLFYKCALYDYKRDHQKKLEAAARMEEILLNDCSFIPAYSRAYRYFFSSRVEPIMEVGDVDLGFCMMQCRFK